jgi:hypothetical protein
MFHVSVYVLSLSAVLLRLADDLSKTEAVQIYIYNYIYIYLSINGFCTPSFLFKEIERNPRLPPLHDFYPGTARLG